jgi:ankyrin repeat protein
MKACFNGKDEIVKMLLFLGAKTDLKNKFGNTALHNAA